MKDVFDGSAHFVALLFGEALCVLLLGQVLVQIIPNTVEVLAMMMMGSGLLLAPVLEETIRWRLATRSKEALIAYTVAIIAWETTGALYTVPDPWMLVLRIPATIFHIVASVVLYKNPRAIGACILVHAALNWALFHAGQNLLSKLS